MQRWVQIPLLKQSLPVWYRLRTEITSQTPVDMEEVLLSPKRPRPSFVRTLKLPRDFQLRSLCGGDRKKVPADSAFFVYNRIHRRFRVKVKRVFGTIKSFVAWLLLRFRVWFARLGPPVVVVPFVPRFRVRMHVPFRHRFLVAFIVFILWLLWDWIVWSFLLFQRATFWCFWNSRVGSLIVRYGAHVSQVYWAFEMALVSALDPLLWVRELFFAFARFLCFLVFLAADLFATSRPR